MYGHKTSTSNKDTIIRCLAHRVNQLEQKMKEQDELLTEYACRLAIISDKTNG